MVEGFDPGMERSGRIYAKLTERCNSTNRCSIAWNISKFLQVSKYFGFNILLHKYVLIYQEYFINTI